MNKRIRCVAAVLVFLAYQGLFVLAEDSAPVPPDDSSMGKEPSAQPDASASFAFVAPVDVPTVVPVLEGKPPRAHGAGLRRDPNVFYIYSDYHSPLNHYAPSGWIGDYGDIRLDDSTRDDPADGPNCIKIQYSAKGSQAQGWAGIYWQDSRGNWGNGTSGYNLSGMKRLTFWARGASGGESIAVFQMGGISGKHPDSGNAAIGPIKLSKEWTHYVIDLSGIDLSHIVGGFSWSASQADNPQGMTFYLDEIRYEK